MKKFPISLLCGVAAILLTVVLFFTIFSNAVLGAIHFISLVAVLLAEVIATVYAYFSKGEPRKVAATIIAAGMVPISVVLSFVYIVNFPFGYGTYLGLYTIASIITNTIAIILYVFHSAKAEENVEFQSAKENMLYLRKLVKVIMADPAAQPWAAQLRALEEKLHFSKDNVIANEDENIRALLLQLQESISDPEFECQQMLQRIERAIDTRNIMATR